MRMIAGVFVVGLVVLTAMPALAQQVEIEAPAPRKAPEPLVIPPGDHYEAPRPSDADNYPDPRPDVRYDPTFVGPLSRTFEVANGTTGRVGIAGWTSPNTPIPTRQTYQETTGWFALGFAIEWGGPPAPPAKRPAR